MVDVTKLDVGNFPNGGMLIDATADIFLHVQFKVLLLCQRLRSFKFHVVSF